MNERGITAPHERTSELIKRFLVLVDGEARDLFTTGMILQRLEYDVYLQHSAEEALELMESALPALVLTEMKLPGMTGMDLLQHIKQDPRTASVPVIIYTATGDSQIEELCLASGCASFLRKPVEPNALFHAIQHVTERTPRQYIRLKTLLPAMVGNTVARGGAVKKEYVLALSENGMYVRTLTPHAIRTVLPVMIMINSIPIKVRAIVLYSFSMGQGPFRESGMGMKFIEIARTDQEHIRDFIRDHLLKDIPFSRQRDHGE
jgi:CheY-like chemotaxis protein